MKQKEIHDILNRLADCVEKRKLEDARSLQQTLFFDLLKWAYSVVRGQASPKILRELLELEIEIGGENGDFRDFGNRQMLDLFARGGLDRHLATRFINGAGLCTAVDLQRVANWLDSPDTAGGGISESAVRFIGAWLALFAEETGCLTIGGTHQEARRVVAEPPPEMAAALPQAGSPFTEPATGMVFNYVPGGMFSMGDSFNEGVEDERPVHEVAMSPFFIGIHPVTQAQWKRLMAENPSGNPGDHHPVEQVAWADVMAFIAKLNAASPNHLHFDLPSEAQWEYAARSGGREERYAGGSDPVSLAWFDENHTGGTAPVGRKSPNGLGLYDMSGNVWEWCRDIYHPEAYQRHVGRDPVCTTGGRDRVIRGGSWHLDAWSARCSRRFRFDPELFGPALGFRMVMVVNGPG